jgi:hypothetical protein
MRRALLYGSRRVLLTRLSGLLRATLRRTSVHKLGSSILLQEANLERS